MANRVKLKIDGIEYVVFQPTWEIQLLMMESIAKKLGSGLVPAWFAEKAETPAEKEAYRKALFQAIAEALEKLSRGDMVELAKEILQLDYIKTDGAPLNIQKQVYKTGKIKHIFDLAVEVVSLSLDGFSPQGVDAPTSGVRGGGQAGGHSAA